MKGKLITNAVLSFLWLIGFIIYIQGIVYTIKIFEPNIPYIISGNLMLVMVVGIVMMAIFGFVSFIMGIITLCTMSSVTQSKGLVIASGILAIFSGACGANFIVSSIAAFKVSN